MHFQKVGSNSEELPRFKQNANLALRALFYKSSFQKCLSEKVLLQSTIYYFSPNLATNLSTIKKSLISFSPSFSTLSAIT